MVLQTQLHATTDSLAGRGQGRALGMTRKALAEAGRGAGCASGACLYRCILLGAQLANLIKTTTAHSFVQLSKGALEVAKEREKGERGGDTHGECVRESCGQRGGCGWR